MARFVQEKVPVLEISPQSTQKCSARASRGADRKASVPTRPAGVPWSPGMLAHWP